MTNAIGTRNDSNNETTRATESVADTGIFEGDIDEDPETDDQDSLRSEPIRQPRNTSSNQGFQIPDLRPWVNAAIQVGRLVQAFSGGNVPTQGFGASYSFGMNSDTHNQFSSDDDDDGTSVDGIFGTDQGGFDDDDDDAMF